MNYRATSWIIFFFPSEPFSFHVTLSLRTNLNFPPDIFLKTVLFVGHFAIRCISKLWRFIF